MLDKLKNMFEAQKKIGEIKKELEKVTIDFSSPDEKIKLKMTGTQKIIALEIAQDLLSAEKKKTLEENLVSSFNAALDKVQLAVSDKLRLKVGDLKIPGF
ncbi:MAG: YbaB/EbfC family nucleoid-associated protein [Candidatus Omnitrophica bacterium]|nr:YbaB/EbfC family nucleoid-associated protein [Candidatus Omnitrophota bacterium]